jgi:hypothetical protein
MRNFLFRVLQGVKKGIFTPTLSPQMLDFQSRPLVRIVRLLGGLSILILLMVSRYPSILGDLNNDFRMFFLIVLVLTGLLFVLLNLYITYHRIKFIKTKLQSSDLDIRNSPLDRFACMLARVTFCAKGVCDSAAPLGLALGFIPFVVSYFSKNLIFISTIFIYLSLLTLGFIIGYTLYISFKLSVLKHEGVLKDHKLIKRFPFLRTVFLAELQRNPEDLKKLIINQLNGLIIFYLSCIIVLLLLIALWVYILYLY